MTLEFQFRTVRRVRNEGWTVPRYPLRKDEHDRGDA